MKKNFEDNNWALYDKRQMMESEFMGAWSDDLVEQTQKA